MLNLLSERQRRNSLSSRHKKSNVLNQINLNMFQPYLPEKKGRNSNASSRMKGKENHKNRKSQQIKQFGIIQGVKFRSYHGELEQKAKQSQTKQKACFKELSPHEIYQNREKMNVAFQSQQKQQTTNRKKSQGHNNQRLASKNQAYLSKYKQAILKIFKGLDIFNRGTITQTNINKWIPEQALYFLGRVFQKIRQERLYLSSDQFLKECLPILHESSEEDVKSFLEQVNGKETMHTVSIDFPSEQKNVNESLVQLKITKDSSLDVKVNKPAALQQYERYNYKPLVPCEDLIGNIKVKEKYLNQRLNSIKERKNDTFLSYKQCNSISPNQKKNENTSHMSKQKNTDNQAIGNFKVSDFQINKKRQFQRITITKGGKNSQPQIDKNDFNFSFQLKQLKNYDTSNNSNLQIRRNEKPISKNQIKLQLGDLNSQKVERNLLPLRTSRIVRQNIKPKEFSSSQKKSIDKQQGTERIDKLSSRLQEYINFNKQKIEKNKKFIRQNSAPKA